MANSMKRLKSSLDDLDDGLLVEILHRLPTSKFANRCKLVSRRWNYLISTPYYAARFAERRMINHNTADSTNLYQEELSSTVVITFLGRHVVGQQLRYRYKRSSLSSGNRIPYLSGHDKEYITILASCCDLVLFGLSHTYFVCNPITKQCIELPSPPRKDRIPNYYGLVITEPCIKISNERGRGRRTIVVKDRCRFRVVLLSYKRRSSLPQVETYCSETGQWNESVLPTSESWPSGGIVAYKGKLHWHHFKDIIVYDPDDVGQVRMMRAPALFSAHTRIGQQRKTCLGVSDGALRFMSMIRGDMIIWELEDNDDAGEWSLKHRLHLKRLVRVDSGVPGYLDIRRQINADALGFHPTNKNIVFLRLRFDRAFTCDILRGTLHPAYQLANEPSSTDCLTDFPLVIPLWPTPIPTLKN